MPLSALGGTHCWDQPFGAAQPNPTTTEQNYRHGGAELKTGGSVIPASYFPTEFLFLGFK